MLERWPRPTGSTCAYGGVGGDGDGRQVVVMEAGDCAEYGKDI